MKFDEVAAKKPKLQPELLMSWVLLKSKRFLLTYHPRSCNRIPMDEFKLENSEYITLKDLLKLTGLCDSGGQAMNAIANGLVKVDGNVELRKRCKIRTGQAVEFQGQKIIVK